MRLRTRIIIAVMAASTAINFFFCFYFTDRLRHFELKSLAERVEQSVYMLKLVNATPVYNVDKESVRLNMETFFKDENMKSISFREYDINIALSRTFEDDTGKEIKKAFYIYYKGLKLGKMEVVYSTTPIEKKMAHIRNQLLMITFIGIAVLTGIVMLLINRLMQPVNNLSRAASDIAAGDLDREIDDSGIGDVAQLSRNFIVMRDAVKEKITDLARINRNLEHEIDQKEKNEQRILRQNLMISSVNRFFQKNMTAESYEEIAKIFINVIMEAVPCRYCLVCDIGISAEGKMEMLAVSGDVVKQLSGESDAESSLRFPDETPLGVRKQTVSLSNSVVLNQVEPGKDLLNYPECRIPAESCLAVPMKRHEGICGIFLLLDKQGGFDNQDVAAAEMLSAALAEALSLKKKEIEKSILEEMMVQSEKMISIGGLAAGMAHEINNPLAGILQNSQVIMARLKEDLPANHRAAEKLGIEFPVIQKYIQDRNIFRLLDLVQDAGRRAADIVSNMLSFSRKSNSGFTPEDICGLLDKTLRLAESDYNLKKQFDFKMIQINKDYAPDLPSVACKAGEIQQVFLNLLSNGAQAMQENPESRPPCFDLKVHHADQMIHVAFHDNGPGIPDTDINRVFEPFFTTKNIGEGTGLGLSVSYFIITENHKGKISVRTGSQVGTVFTVSLPVHTARNQNSHQQSAI